MSAVATRFVHAGQAIGSIRVAVRCGPVSIALCNGDSNSGLHCVAQVHPMKFDICVAIIERSRSPVFNANASRRPTSPEPPANPASSTQTVAWSNNDCLRLLHRAAIQADVKSLGDGQ